MQDDLAYAPRIKVLSPQTHDAIAQSLLEQMEKQLQTTSSPTPSTVTPPLQNRKTNWKQYQNLLAQHGINRLYHFTDRSNIASIKKYGGLYSWDYCIRNNIAISKAGGDTLSRDLDSRYGLEDYVRCAFVKDHPMMFVALRDGRINEPVILEISIEVCFFENTLFSDINATGNGHHIGGELADLTRVRFDVFNNRYVNMIDTDKKFYQAEVLAKTWIPLDFITNINQF
jgi:hypothetical protein